MSSKKVVVVGVGALGSHVVQFMRNLDVHITVIDYDRVERKNVQSQFHAKGTVGKSKVAGLKQSMNFLFGTKVVTVPHMLTRENVDVLLKGSDLVIDCLDNAEARTIIQNYCRESSGYNSIPCLHGALDGAGSFGRVVWSPQFTIDQEPAVGTATCEDGRFLPFITITAAYLSRSAQIFLEENRTVGYTVHPSGASSL